MLPGHDYNRGSRRTAFLGRGGRRLKASNRFKSQSFLASAVNDDYNNDRSVPASGPQPTPSFAGFETSSFPEMKGTRLMPIAETKLESKPLRRQHSSRSHGDDVPTSIRFRTFHTKQSNRTGCQSRRPVMQPINTNVDHRLSGASSATMSKERKKASIKPAEKVKQWSLRAAGKAADRQAMDFELKSPLARQAKELRELQWSDVRIGKLLGHGTFSRVFEVKLSNNIAMGREDVNLGDEPEPDPMSPVSFPSHLENGMASTDANTSVDLLLDVHDGDCLNVWDQSIISDSEKPAKVFALKHLDTSALSDQESYIECAIDLVMEAKLLNALSHPNIIRLHGITEGSIVSAFHNQGFFLLLERLYGTLEDRLEEWIENEKQSSVIHRLNVTHEIAEALAYLHDRRVVFRDLKPTNIGFSEEGWVKLFDFGLAKEIRDDSVKLTGRTGSLRYMAPEIALSQHYGLKADQYSFGILLWEICTLRKPYGGMSKKDHLDKVVYGNARPDLREAQGISSDLKKLMARCWQGKAHTRPQFSDIIFELRRECESHEARRSSRGLSVLRQKASQRILSRQPFLALGDGFDEVRHVELPSMNDEKRMVIR